MYELITLVLLGIYAFTKDTAILFTSGLFAIASGLYREK